MKWITQREWYKARGYVEQPSPIPGMTMVLDPRMPKDTIVIGDLDRSLVGVPDDWLDDKMT